MTDMQVFEYQGMAEVRTIVRDGEPWFVAGDVCKVLGIVNNRDAVNRLNNADVGSTDIWSQANNRSYATTIVNESGLYDLILDSRKPEAKAFRRWITSEVLPSIRQTGGYLSPEVDFNDPHKLMVLLENWAADRERAELAEAQLTIETHAG